MTVDRKWRIAIDMDDVLADTLTKFLLVHNRESGESLTEADVRGRRLLEFIPIERIRQYAAIPGFFRDISVKAGSIPVLQALRERYEVFIASAAMEFPTSFNDKYAWIKEHFPDFPDTHIVFCGDKSIVAADFLIDDTPRHFERFIGQGYLFTAPHNLKENRYPRLNNWEDVRRQFLSEDHVE